MPRTWTAIDFETANQDRGSACAVGLVRVADGAPVERFSTLIRPPEPVSRFSARNTAVHGITAADVTGAPGWEQVWHSVLDFVDGGVLVAHNAAFDMGVVRSACAHTGAGRPELEYVCTLALARRTWPELGDHRLPTVCSHIGHRMRHHHRADHDAEACARIVVAALGRHGTGCLEELARATGTPVARLEAAAPTAPAPVTAAPLAPAGDFERWQSHARAVLPDPCPEADPRGPLFGRVVCVSGDLAAMDKPQVWRRVAEAGGRPAKNVTRTTDVLVVGAHSGPGKTAKHLRAQAYRERGQRIDIITEAELLVRLGLGRG
ncbi:exonuclease domain-containing protein [Nocardiopsis sp. CNT312]|uniref:exonuclease domain-containing protein n=1 Tax=Nocardiopsis sp. CNT312 TaxID=1137268 RepID=UPI00048F9CBE|nr:exonuclease domain-containing protein [Nocardiopsis sp. CNT312]